MGSALARTALLMALVLAAALLTWLALFGGPLPRLDLPPFDPKRAPLLSPGDRQSFEQELFSELRRWKDISHQYPELRDIRLREQRWMYMSHRGFELAHITLRVLGPADRAIHNMKGAMRRLEELAESGDTGAMCLMTPLAGVAAWKMINPEGYLTTARKWLLKGEQLGHPQCKTEVGRRLLLGTDGFPRDPKRGLELEFEARRAGYVHEVAALVDHYKRKGMTDADNVRRYYCWSSVEQLAFPRNSRAYKLEAIERDIEHSPIPSVRALINDLRGRQFSVDECVRLGQGEA